jgi:carboxypeptidase C (cathepsin A)
MLSLLLLAVHTAGFSLFSRQQSSRDSIAKHKPDHGEITSLPGYEGQLTSKHYGGYVSVGSRKLYYYLVESERSPADDPTV